MLDVLFKEKKISNRYLTKKLHVSDSTLRRDLDILEEAGKIRRVHGGAVLNIKTDERSFTDNEQSMLEEKKSIGRKAAKLIPDKSLVYLDAGSTTNELIDFIEAKDIRIVTNGLMHLTKLMERGIDTVIIGGRLKARTRVTTGVIAMNELCDFNFDLAFIGANGFDDEYFYTADINEALIKRKAIELSNKAFILADSSKEHEVYHAKIIDRCDVELIEEDR
ncbi:MAG: DeoR/GlpR family DNA-binding transcription regulator [Anaerococcus prevotii]|nr:DeoR/GlpR family DNA-binding transcription regulator [Anaerococcus prevotii]